MCDWCGNYIWWWQKRVQRDGKALHSGKKIFPCDVMYLGWKAGR